MTSLFSLNFPINSVSFGSVSIALLRELFKRGLNPPLFPIGPVDLSTQKPDVEFNTRLQNCINSAQQKHARKNGVIKLWHINDSLSSYSERGNDLITFYELDNPTPTEINILRQQRRIYVTSRYSQTVFDMFGIKTEYLPLGFDSHNFVPLDKRPFIHGVTQFLLTGKAEKRKSTYQILHAWAKKYGNNKDYRLNCAIHNHFLPPEAQNQLINQALEGKHYWNINFLPWATTNMEYNVTLQSSDIILCTSGGEGRDLPCYHATALGAWPVALKAHAYLDYLTDENAIWVSPNGKQPATDGIFFRPDASFNVGNIFCFDDEAFIAGCEEAEKRVKSLGINKKGMELMQSTYALTVDTLLNGLEKS